MTNADYLGNLPPLIPREVIFGNPERADAKISPDGARMAYLAPDEGVLNVWVGEVGGDDYHPVTRDRDRGVRIYFWAHDGKHLLYLQDVAGDENWRLHKVHLASGAVEDLTPFENVQVQIAAHDKRRPDELLLAMNKEDERLHDIYSLDLSSGRLEMVAKNPGSVMGWVADADHRVRAALAATAAGGTELLVRDDPEADWRSLLTWSPEDSLTSAPYGFTLQDGTLAGEAPSILQHVLSQLGVKEVEGVITEFGSLIPGIQAKRFDVIAAGMFILPKRCQQIVFSEPVDAATVDETTLRVSSISGAIPGAWQLDPSGLLAFFTTAEPWAEGP